MLHDIRTIIWKEFKDIYHLTNTFEFKLKTLFFLILFGIAFPFWKGEEILYSDSISIIWLGMILISNIQLSIGSFVSERENYSFETLLASRLPDKAIIWGKLLSYTIFSYIYIILFTLLNVSTLIIIIKAQVSNINYSTFPAKNLYFILLTCFLGALFSSAVGMFLSLKAKNWDQAQNNIRTGYVFIIISLVIVYNIIKSLNGYIADVQNSCTFIKFMTSFYIIAILFVLLLIFRKFKRPNLII